MLGLTFSSLSSSKTATGSITFALTNSPEMSMNINYKIDANNKTYLGTTQGAEISSSTDVLRVNIKDNSSIKVQIAFNSNTITIPSGFALSTNNGVNLSLSSNSNGVAIWQASSVSAGDYIVLDKLLSGIYPTSTVFNLNYELAVTSQASEAVPATAKLSGIYSVIYQNYIVTISKNADYGTLSQSSISVPYNSTYSVSSNVMTFKNSQGTILQTITATPNQSTAQYKYSFSSWSSTSGIITGTSSITANFTRTIEQYTITFYNFNGDELGVTSTVDYGETATYTGATPTRAEDDDYTYEFAGWVTSQGGTTTDNLSNVVENRNVYATYNSISKGFALTYDNSNNIESVLNATNGNTQITSGDLIKAGTLIQFTITHTSFNVTDSNGDAVECTSISSSCYPTYTFIMPAVAVHITDNSSGHIGGYCCVYEDTLITLADGATKRADQIQVGDKILNYNFETCELEEDTITEILQRNRLELITIDFTDGTQLKITNDHPLFTELGWKCYDCEFGSTIYSQLGITDKFKLGDKLFSLSKYFDKEIANITYEEDENGYNTYQFATQNNDNYFANGVLSADL